MEKIIHQTAPSNKSNWHPIWEICQKSWNTTFPSPEYKYMFWNDDDLLNLIKSDFPTYLQLYNDFGKNTILKVDFARYAILYKYGGIYADMDFMCKKNFYNMLTNNIIIVESSAPSEIVQNSLMASPAGHIKWLDVLDECKQYYYQFIKDNPNKRITGKYVIDITGPRLLSRALDMKSIQILPKQEFNPYSSSFNSDKIYTKHFGTGKWGPSAGIRNFTNLRNTDYDLNKFYNSLDLNYNLKNIPEGYLVFKCGKHNTNIKEIDLCVPIHDNTNITFIEHPYKDKFITTIKDNKLTMKRIDGWGWGHDHHLYFKGDSISNNIIESISSNIKIKINKCEVFKNRIKLSIPLPNEVKFSHTTECSLKITLLHNNLLEIERTDKKEGWNNNFWIYISI
jgi:mannosyltransferase OCH1-like enzyme